MNICKMLSNNVGCFRLGCLLYVRLGCICLHSCHFRTSVESYNFTGDAPGASVFNLPFPIGAIHRVSDNHLLLTECDSQRFVLVYGVQYCSKQCL